MTDKASASNYNNRLFGKGVRRWLHIGRFLFIAQMAKDMHAGSVFELGCFDGRAIGYLPVLPKTYIGADRGSLDCLERARDAWPQYQFLEVSSARELSHLQPSSFDLLLCLETFEHMPQECAAEYLKFLRYIANGPLLVTLPVEIGPVFFFKYLAKMMFRSLRAPRYDEYNEYTFWEVICATLGFSSRVRRIQHKGFDYRTMKREIERYFDVPRCEGIPFRWMPVWMNFGVGMVCTPKSLEQV